MESRYDAVAQGYAEATRDWVPTGLSYLPDHLHDQRVLDLACGNGSLSRLIAERGATVTAVDASTGMLGNATPAERVAYLHGNAADTRWWDGVPFDGVVSNMALMDIKDLAGALTTIATVAAPRAWVLISLLHPCFPGQGETRTKPSWPPERGYSWEGWWTTGGDGVRGHVGAYHRTLATYLNAVMRAGLEIVEVVEPANPVPRELILRCRRRRST